MVALAEPPPLITVPRCEYHRGLGRLIAVAGLPVVVLVTAWIMVRASSAAWWRMVRDPRRAVDERRRRVVSGLIDGQLRLLHRELVRLAAGAMPRASDSEVVTLMANKVLIDMEGE